MSKIVDIEYASISNSVASESTLGESRIECLSKILAILIIAIVIVPFGITNVYYAYTDKSCVNLRAGKLYINLQDYLVINGIWYLLNFIFNSVIITYLNTNKIVKFYNNPITKLIGTIGAVFNLSWTIIGGIIFWSLIDNNECDKGVYNYVFAQLIIQFVIIGGSVFSNLRNLHNLYY